MNDDLSYRSSHTGIGKGKKYDKSFVVNDYRQFIFKWEKEILKKIVKDTIFNRENYLDFACGTGRITSILEDSFENSYGIDVSKTMINEAKEKLTKTKIFHQDITTINPFEPNQMNLITSFRFFLNAEPQLREDVLKQLYKILDPEGYLVFNIHNNKTIFLRVIDKLTILKKRLEGKKFVPQKSFSLQETKAILQMFGFKIERIYHKSVIPIKSENSGFKISKFSRIEDFFSRINFFKFFSRNIIFVCKKN